MNGYEIAEEVGCCPKTIYNRLIKYGIERREYKGENHREWRGGRYIQRGYIMVKAYDHPNRNNLNYVSEHVLVMEKEIGRYIVRGEIIHHINGKRDDNRIENLILCDNKKEHRKIDKNLRAITYELIDNGIIIFDKDKREYRVSVIE